MHLRIGNRARTGAGARQAAKRPPSPWNWQVRWLDLGLVTAVVVTVVVCLTKVWPAPLELTPLLAVPPALAAVGASTVKRPVAYGAVAAVAAIAIDAIVRGGITVTNGAHELPLAAAGAIAVTTALGIAGIAIGARNETVDHDEQEQQFANVTSVAEAAQRALLRPLPEQLGPLKLGVVYLAAAAEARVGGDLYEVTHTERHGIRLIIGDVRGKGLGAIDVAADIIGRFSEVAHDVHTLDELAYRLDAGLTRRWGQYEEFVTALFVQIDPDLGKLTILNCGHPPPILISPGDSGVNVLEVRAPAPPLGLLTLGNDSGAKAVFNFKPNDQLLLYTDGVSEARDAAGRFFPLAEVTVEAVPAGGSLLDTLVTRLEGHVGDRGCDDILLLLVTMR